jgi:hypothetical protein
MPRLLNPPSERRPDVVIGELWSALHAEYPDTYFCYAGGLVERRGDQLKPVTTGSLAAPLAHSVAFVSGAQEGQDPEAEEKLRYKAPTAEMRLWLHSDAKRGCLPLDGIVRTPVLTPDGRVITKPGYDAPTRLWLHWEGPSLDPWSLSQEQISDTLERILDFPFVERVDKVHALALYLEPLVRPAIVGATPLWMLTADHEQAGKTYVGRCVGTVALGRFPDERGLDSWSSEASRQLTAYLLAAPSFLFLDNLPTRSTVGGSDLHRYLTAEGPVGIRELGSSVERLVNIKTTWVATVNSPDMDPEQARRTMCIRLRHVPQRTYKTDRLSHWILQNRPLVVSVLLRIILEWIRHERPRASRALASYEAWSDILGGILSVVPGCGEHFLAPSSRPVPKLHQDLERLLRHWPHAVPAEELLSEAPSPKACRVTAGQLLPELKKLGLVHLLDAIEAKNEHGMVTRLGGLLRRLVEEGRVLGGHRLISRHASDGATYTVQPAGATEPQAQPVGK